MLARLKMKTQYTNYSNSVVSDLSHDSNNVEARIEYILRQSNSSFLLPFGNEATARKICDEEIRKFPQHNFFNFARAQLESNSGCKQIHLITAAKSCLPCGANVSGEAAYELAVELLPKKNESLTPSAAWFSRAIILHNSAAIDGFLNNDFCSSNRMFGANTLCAILLTTHLSGVKISGLEKSRLLKNRDFDVTPFSLAYRYPLDANAFSRPDSPIIKIMEQFIARSKTAFVTYFCYCMQHDIISEEIFRNLMLFYLNSGYTDQHGLRQKAMTAIAEHNLLDKLNYPAPQASVIYLVPQPIQQTYMPAPYASAPLVTNHGDPANSGSYYYMYSMDPQMMPAQPQIPQQPMLVPEYRPAAMLQTSAYVHEQKTATTEAEWRVANRQ